MPATYTHLPVDPVPDPAVLGDGEVLGTVAAARRLGVVKSKLYQLMNSGALAYVQDGPCCRRRIPVAALLAYEARNLKQQ